MVFLHINLCLFFVIVIFNLLVNCSPSGMIEKLRRQERGIFVPEPKLLRNRDLIWLYNITTEDTGLSPATTEFSTTQTKKKWQVGRVSRKQYEIVNMIWRKTKIFADVETTPISTDNNVQFIKMNHKNGHFTPLTTMPSTLRSKLQPTESYIEFYYLEENDKHNNEKKNRSTRLTAEYLKNHPSKFQQLLQVPNNFKPLISNSPILAFRVNDGTSAKPHKATTTHYRSNLPYLYFQPSYNNKPNSLWDMINFGYITTKSRTRLKNSIFSDDKKSETCPQTTQPNTESTPTTIKGIEISAEDFDTLDSFTTIYDKIKFFELYDRQTQNIKKVSDDSQDDKNMESHFDGDLKDGRDVQKVLLEHVDVGINHHDKFAKKHVSRDTFIHDSKSTTQSLPPYIQRSLPTTKRPLQTTQRPAVDDYFSQQKVNISNYSLRAKLDEASSRDQYTYSDMSKAASWSDYPFAAVYVYEPSQVLCDAAAISNHWLITAGSCLSRQHRLEPTSDGRSAFVTYCGAAWRQPERIAYVKYTLVHPKFNVRDRSRRFLYNIGVIQVVSSLSSACPGWKPINLMSHHFTSDAEVSLASAVGWGLDRYATKYPDTDIPTHSMMVYDGQIHSDDCPGNIGYSEAKQVEALNVMKNVYCLSLPPYKKEEYDPVHGSLLLVGGKLVALYLQEERRVWGEQSAMYTGIWRLIPWVLEVAREAEDIDAFTAEI